MRTLSGNANSRASAASAAQKAVVLWAVRTDEASGKWVITADCLLPSVMGKLDRLQG